MTLKNWLLLLVPVAAAVVAWTWWNGDEQRILRRLSHLSDTIEKGPGENQLLAALRSQEVAAVFADPFEFRARPFDFATRDRQTLVRTVAAYRLRSERIGVRTFDRRLDVDEVARKATMVLSMRFVGGLRGLANEGYRFQLNWIEQAGDWKIEYVDLLEVQPALGARP